MAPWWDRATAIVLSTIAGVALSSCADDSHGSGYPFGAPTTMPPTSSTETGASGSDDGDGEGPQPGLDCGPSWSDDIDLQGGGRVELPAEAVALTTVGSDTVVCGQGFVAAIDSGGTLSDVVELDGTCRGIAADGGVRAIAGFDDGTVVAFEVSSGSLDEVDRSTAPAGVHGVAAGPSGTYVAAGHGGLLFSADGLGELAPLGGVSDARGVAVAGQRIYVAANTEGLLMLDPDGSATGIDTIAPALGVVARDGRAIVLEGTEGWELVEQGGVTAQSTTQGVVVDAAFAGGHILTADGYAIVRHRWGGSAMVPVAIEHRWDRGTMAGRWLRAIEPVGQGFVALYGDLAVPVAVDPFEGAPDAWMDVPSISMWIEDGEPADAAYLLKNTGTEPLLVGHPQIGAPFSAELQTDGLEEADDCADAWEVPPGGSALIEITFAPSSNDPVSTELRIPTNDPDEGTIQIPVDGNHPALAPGDDAPDFTALTIDGELFRLSDQRGKVVLLKMFNFGCSTCSDEFPAIEDELVARYDSDEFIAVGVNTAHRTAFAATLAADAGLSLPMVLDLDSEAFRHYRIPFRVFPLHVVIDAEGKIVAVTNEKGLGPVEAAVEDAM